MSKNREIEIDAIDFIDALIGASLIAAHRGYDRSKNFARKVNNTAKSTADKAKKYVQDKQNERAPKITDFIDRIIAQDTATIIFWKDGTKTSVKCGQGEAYDYEKGIAMAVLKYIFGNRYYKDMQKLMEEFPYVAKAPEKEKPAKATDKKAKTAKESKKSAKKTEEDDKKSE